MTKIMFSDEHKFGLVKSDEKLIRLEGEIESFSICDKDELCIWIKDKPGCYRYNLKKGRHIFVQNDKIEA